MKSPRYSQSPVAFTQSLKSLHLVGVGCRLFRSNVEFLYLRHKFSGDSVDAWGVDKMLKRSLHSDRLMSPWQDCSCSITADLLVSLFWFQFLSYRFLVSAGQSSPCMCTLALSCGSMWLLQAPLTPDTQTTHTEFLSMIRHGANSKRLKWPKL